MTTPDDTVFLGVEDGLSIYAKRSTIDGVDRVMQADHMRRQAHDNAAWALWEYNQKQKAKGEKA